MDKTFEEWWLSGTVSEKVPYKSGTPKFWAHAGWLAALENARVMGRTQGLEQVTKGEYISVEELRKMSVEKLGEFVHDYSEE